MPQTVQDQSTQQDQNPNAPIFVQAFEGVRNTSSAERIGPNAFVVGQNIDIDNDKQVHMRRGRTLKAAGSWHSIWNAGNGGLYGVRNGSLGFVQPDYTHVPIVDVGLDWLSYVEIDRTMYWSSKSAHGKIDLDQNVNSDWGTLNEQGVWWSPVLEPSDTLGQVGGKLLRNPPKAEFMVYHNGRIYLALDKMIWATELFKYDYVDATRTYMMFEDGITGMAVVSDGLYVGTARNAYFLSGEFGKMQRVVTNSNPVIKGTMVPAVLDDYPEHPIHARTAINFATTQGLCVGFDRGIYKNLTQEHFWFPPAESGSATIRQQDGITQFLSVFRHGGTPASGARIGDYVDAEIRRFQGE